MQKFSAHAFYETARYLEAFSRAKSLDDFNKIHAGVSGQNIVVLCQQIGLRMSVLQFQKLNDLIKTNPSVADVQAAASIVHGRIEDEMRLHTFFHITEEEACFYEPKEPLCGAEVEVKWPKLIEDISEAGKCIALARYTASVFHLMRVMEFGVQRFGDMLGVTLPTAKPWGNILNEAKVPIDALPKGDPRKPLWNETWAHLDSVRLAWRNEVMHPKQTYTAEEAKEVLEHVRTYIRHLAKII